MRRTAALLLVAGLLAAGCGSGGSSGDRASGGFPLTVTNCGDKVTVDKPPQRVVIIGNDEIPLLTSVGVLDRVIAKAGSFPTGVYGGPADALLRKIPTLGNGVNSEGTTQISLESVIGQRPDLVVGYETTTITRSGLRAAGIPMVIDPAYCANVSLEPKNVSFSNVYRQVAFYAKLFGRPTAGEKQIATLKAREQRVRSTYVHSGRKAATLFVGKASGVVEAYGRRGMANAEMTAAGLTNVFADVDQRVFQVSAETLIAKRPDVLILVGAGTDTSTYEQDLLTVTGARTLPAVRHRALLPELFGYTDPPTPLSVTGLERIASRFGTRK